MPIQGESITVNFVVWDTVNNCGKIDDESNITLRIIQDGTAAECTNDPLPVDDTYCPGVYKITLTNDEMDCAFITVAGTTSSSGCVVIPVSMSTEQGNTTFLKDYMGGKREKVANQLVCYKEDNTTEICRFNTFDEDGDPAMENIYSRERVV